MHRLGIILPAYPPTPIEVDSCGDPDVLDRGFLLYLRLSILHIPYAPVLSALYQIGDHVIRPAASQQGG